MLLVDYGIAELFHGELFYGELFYVMTCHSDQLLDIMLTVLVVLDFEAGRAFAVA